MAGRRQRCGLASGEVGADHREVTVAGIGITVRRNRQCAAGGKLCALGDALTAATVAVALTGAGTLALAGALALAGVDAAADGNGADWDAWRRGLAKTLVEKRSSRHLLEAVSAARLLAGHAPNERRRVPQRNYSPSVTPALAD